MITNVTAWLDDISLRFPDKQAYADEERTFTFAQTKERALHIASQIVASSDCFKAPVAVFMEKSVDMIVSMFGVAYSGNFYTPLDITMPESRIKKILDTLRPALVVTKTALRQRAEECFSEASEKPVFICIDDAKLPPLSPAAVYEKRSRSCDTDVLYVLFTSGSTGTPKGVIISHRAVIDFIEAMEELLRFDETASFGNQGAFSFDLSIPDLYMPLKTGASTHIIPKKLFMLPLKLLDYLRDKEINTVFWVPSALIVLSKLNALKSRDMNGILKNVLFCGEIMPNKQLNIWRKYLPEATYVNFYGPTETTCASTYYIVDREFADEEPLPIGAPMSNTDILVLDENDAPVLPCDTETVGELCIRGWFLSFGYYNNPQKTAEAFVQNPLQQAYAETVYRTGDLVRYNEAGELLYLSRKDFQIKRTGHRIELGEIETALSSLDEVSLCCCLYDEAKGHIVAFLEGELSLQEVNARLKTLLPEYMLPNRVLCVEQMPFNDNGKIDRKKLKELI